MSIADTPATQPRLRALTYEGFRLFFVLSAGHMALWPFLWVVMAGLDLPLSGDTPPPLWHAHELIVGSFGAALVGFLTTALPEWTDTEPLRGRPLVLLAVPWSIARIIGLLGWDGAAWLAGFCDLLWLGALIAYAAWLSWQKWTDRFLAFLFWLVVLSAAEVTARIGMILGDYDLTQLGTHGTGFAFLGLLAIALGRITVPVTNLVLDPTETSSPFRPHPGRLTLAAGLVFVAMVGETAGLSENVRGFLWIAAGAGFLDRVGEAFIGRAFFRLEILVLAGSAALAGAGLLLLGASLLGAPFGPHAGLHLGFMGGLGMGVLAVFAIAGLMHTGRSLQFPRTMWIAFGLLVAATLTRIGPDLGLIDHPFGAPYVLASMLWAGAALTWLVTFWPMLSRIDGGHSCG
ncbi:NnrS family protein [Aliiroseovarius sp.]|uniref:NnrS family protein n=1 Tax=Aliiroseovarius sp. TaxID=1872442 RepID=UPI003BAC0DEB